MKSIFFLLFTPLALFITSCGGDDIDNPITKKAAPKASDYFPLAEGNYWVYELYEILLDSSEEYESYKGVDSVYVEGIKVFGNDTFYQVSYSSTFFNQKNQLKFYKDSAGYLIEKPGLKTLSIDNFNDTLSRYDQKQYQSDKILYRSRYYMEKYSGNVTTPAGVFDSVLNRVQRLNVTQKSSYSSLYPRNYNNLYAKGIGKVYYDFSYLSGKTIIEARLVKYRVN